MRGLRLRRLQCMLESRLRRTFAGICPADSCCHGRGGSDSSGPTRRAAAKRGELLGQDQAICAARRDSAAGIRRGGATPGAAGVGLRHGFRNGGPLPCTREGAPRGAAAGGFLFGCQRPFLSSGGHGRRTPFRGRVLRTGRIAGHSSVLVGPGIKPWSAGSVPASLHLHLTPLHVQDV